MEAQISDLTATIDTWLEAYGEADPARRAELVRAVWSPDGTLADPPFSAHGHAEIAGLVDAVLAHYPGHRFARTSEVDAHHGFGRYGWELVGPNGAVAVEGTDVVRVSDDGRLTHVVGFFGDPAPRA